MAKILVIDDDENLRNTIIRILKDDGHDVEASTGAIPALKLIEHHTFNIIISDIRMPNGDGIFLTKSIRENGLKIPIVLMTGFSEIYNATGAYEVGANEFIAKPFKKDELLTAIKTCLASPQINQDKEKIQEDFCKLSIIDFISGKKIPTDVYLKLSDKKFIKIAHKDDSFPMAQLEKYKLHGVQHLYMRKNEFSEYIGINLTIGKKLENNKTISHEKKLNFMKHTNEILLERIFLNDINEEQFDLAKSVTETTVNLFTDDNNTFQMLELLNDHSDHLYAHSIGVSLYGVMLAKQMQWNSIQTVFKISAGGLLHDIGKKELSKELIEKARRNMSHEEILLYESHPTRGLKILTEIRTIPPEILQIVSQHHENCNGLGFPGRLSRHHIFPLARLIAVVDSFCNLTINSKENARMTVKDAINHMAQFESKDHDKDMFQALAQMCGVKLQKK